MLSAHRPLDVNTPRRTPHRPGTDEPAGRAGGGATGAGPALCGAAC